MRLSLITTKPEMVEHQRLGQEAKALGHQLQTVDISDFTYQIKANRLHFPPITNLQTDIAIFRAVFHHIKCLNPLAKYLRDKNIKIFDNHLIKHQYSIHKITDLLKFSNHHLPLPHTIYTRNVNDYARYADQITYPVILKLTRTGKGAGIYKADSKSQLEQIIAQQHHNGQADKPFILQQFIPYRHDLRILIIGKHTFTMKRIPKNNDFRANFSLGGTVEPFDPPKDIAILAKRALQATNLTLGGVDVLIDTYNQPYILEVNHTPGMVGMEQATQQNITRIYLQHALNHAT